MVAPLATVFVAVATAVLGVVYAMPASAAAGDTHWFILNDAGSAGPWDVYQQIGHPDGSFNGRVRISAQTGRVSGIIPNHGVSAVRVGGRMHLFVTTVVDGCSICTDPGLLLYSMQNTDGTWPAWKSILMQPEGGMNVVATNVAGQLHVVVVAPPQENGDTRILHSVKQANGQWLPFGDLTAYAGNPGDISYQLALAGMPNGELHVLVTGRSEKILHTVRSADGSWSKWANILGHTGRAWAKDNPAYGPNELVAAAVGADLHLLFENNGVIYHTIRYPAGNWLGWGNMSRVTGLNRYDLSEWSATGYSNGTLVVGGVHSGANDLRRTMRHSDAEFGSWDPWTSTAVPTSARAIGGVFLAGE